jgi:hypothetical protein
MVAQQTNAQKEKGFFKVFEGIIGDSVGAKELKKVIKFLSEDYVSSIRIAGNLSSHSKWIPYPFLAESLKKIADELREHAEIFRAKVMQLGGEVPRLNSGGPQDLPSNHTDYMGNGFRQSLKRLVTDMEEHSSMCESLIHQKNVITDADTVKILDKIILDMQRQKDELLNVIMRIS